MFSNVIFLRLFTNFISDQLFSLKKITSYNFIRKLLYNIIIKYINNTSHQLNFGGYTHKIKRKI